MEDILSHEFEDPSDGSVDAFGNLSAAAESLCITEVEDWSPLPGSMDGVEKKILNAGVELSEIEDKDVVLCHYSFTIEGDVEPYDSSLLRNRKERLTMGNVLPGVELALRSMKKAERAAFRIQPPLAYGPMGCPPRIPPNSVILAEIKVFDFMDSKSCKELLRRPQELASKYSFKYVYDLVHREYMDANNRVKRKEFTSAAKLYDGGIQVLDIVPVSNDDEDEDRKKLLHKLRLNVGLCYIQIGKHAVACDMMHQVLLDEPDNVRALYRMGKAKRMLGSTKDAQFYLKKASSFAPRDPDIRRELRDLKKDVELLKKYERAMGDRIKESYNSKS